MGKARVVCWCFWTYRQVAITEFMATSWIHLCIYIYTLEITFIWNGLNRNTYNMGRLIKMTSRCRCTPTVGGSALVSLSCVQPVLSVSDCVCVRAWLCACVRACVRQSKTSPDWLRLQRGHLMHSVNRRTLDMYPSSDRNNAAEAGDGARAQHVNWKKQKTNKKNEII